MIRIIRELRRREVFRTLGLYVGICWILIEVSSVVLPAFEAPDWVLRGMIVAAIVGFPIVTVLAWIYDITGHGIEVQADATDTIVQPIGGRKMDFVVIGILSVALIFSVYMNVTSEPQTVVAQELEPVSVLIADFANSTGESIFDGLLEQALNIGIESAPHILSYARTDATALGGQLQPGATGLSSDVARLVAVREGINLVLSGSVAKNGNGFRLEVSGVDPVSGEPGFDVSTDAASREAVLTAVGTLSEEVREALGDDTLKQDEDATAETFTAASIEAASAYMQGIELAYEGRDDEAVEHFEEATERDPNFGRAFSGWALSEFKLGREEEAKDLWEKALSLMGTMTERERLRTQGLYFASITRNLEKAYENFAELVEKYPADAAARNNLAVVAFLTLDFQTASEQGKQILEIFPNSQLYRSNYALYAMYSGEFEAAAAEARAIIEEDPSYGTSYLPLAISLLATGDTEGARQTYQSMASASATSEHGESLAKLGLADTDIYLGQFDAAIEILEQGIEQDLSQEARSSAAVKEIALAEAHLGRGENARAVEAARRALELSTQESVKIAAAIVQLNAGDTEAAASLGDELSRQLQPQSRAYGLMIKAAVRRESEDYVAAIDLLRQAIGFADLWRIRYELGRAYLEAGYFAEAFDEFENCLERRGEATAMFLDDVPTYRYLAELPYWTARAQGGIGMQAAAVEGYETFLALRPQGGPWADDARQRMQ